MKKLSLICICLITFLSGFAQNGIVKGTVSGKGNELLAFATVYAKGTTFGTTTNDEGKYFLQLPVGKYELVVQYVGYSSKSQEIRVTTGQPLEVNVALQEETLTLGGVEIKASNEDFAYSIIRKAQKNRKKYRDEIESFRCKVYLKGLNRLGNAPKAILGRTVTADTGIVYLSESVSDLSFQQPAKFKEIIIASKVSGSNQGFSFNQASGLQLNFYDNLIGVGFAERGLVSPIANNAMNFYEYEWLGTQKQDSLEIHKIKVIPKRNTDPVFNGIIYITEGSWRIHSVDVKIGKDNQVEFIKEALVQQVYTPTKEGVWVILSQRFDFDFSFLGFKGGGYFLGVYSEYEIKPAFDKKYFSNEVLKISEESNKKDSTFWNKIRPVPLNKIEVTDYIRKDSISRVKETKTYKDSVDKKSNKFRPLGLFLTGYSYRNSWKNYSLQFTPILNFIQYNTVEGWVLNAPIAYNKTYKDKRAISIFPTLRYGFSEGRFNPKITFGYLFNPKKSARFNVEVGKSIEQFNPDAITADLNTGYTLFDKQNFMKIYQKNFAAVRFGQELFNGFNVVAGLEYAQRKPLQNTSSEYYGRSKTREFSSNNPINTELSNTAFEENNALKFSASVRILFQNKYTSYPNQKINLGSKYPELTLNYQKGLAWFDSKVNYDRLELRLEDDFKVGLFGETDYKAFAGTYLNANELSFIDYKHFDGNQTFLAFPTFKGYQLLDYYSFSTSKSYAGGHLQHHFNGYFFNRLPLIKKLKIQEVISANYLYSETNGNYVEFGVGIEHIFKVLRVDYYWSWLNGVSQNNGLRIGIGF